MFMHMLVCANNPSYYSNPNVKLLRQVRAYVILLCAPTLLIIFLTCITKLVFSCRPTLYITLFLTLVFCLGCCITNLAQVDVQ